MNTVRKNRLTAALIAALLLPTAAVAQQTDAASEKSEKQVAADEASKTEVQQLTGITVTARKREETLQTVPVAVTAYSAASLDNLDVQDLGDLDAFVPNLTVYAARGSNSTVTAYIRGIGQADPLWGVDPGVGIYLDDVYIARPQGALLDVFDVERIEVLRGPQGTLFGRNTLAGVRDYGNRMGIPTVNGAVYFDDRHVGNPLVFAGCIGLIPRAMVKGAARRGDLGRALHIDAADGEPRVFGGQPGGVTDQVQAGPGSAGLRRRRPTRADAEIVDQRVRSCCRCLPGVVRGEPEQYLVTDEASRRGHRQVVLPDV